MTLRRFLLDTTAGTRIWQGRVGCGGKPGGGRRSTVRFASRVPDRSQLTEIGMSGLQEGRDVNAFRKPVTRRPVATSAGHRAGARHGSDHGCRQAFARMAAAHLPLGQYARYRVVLVAALSGFTGCGMEDAGDTARRRAARIIDDLLRRGESALAVETMGRLGRPALFVHQREQRAWVSDPHQLHQIRAAIRRVPRRRYRRLMGSRPMVPGMIHLLAGGASHP